MSLITGSVGIERTLAVLAQLEDGNAQPIEAWQVGFWCAGKWRAEVLLDFKPVAVSPFHGLADTWVVLGMDGEVLWIEGAISRASPQTRHDIICSGLPAFTTIVSFNGGVVAAGMGRNVFWSNGDGWTRLGSGIPEDRPEDLSGFEALCVSGRQLYACGWRGEIWSLSEGRWSQEDSPTNIMLTGMASNSRGTMLLCGRLGTILQGQSGLWLPLDHEQTDEDFWSITEFQGREYLSSMRAIYELVDSRLVPIDDGSDSATYYQLSANAVLLASIGSQTVLVSDGDQWQTILALVP